MGLSDGSDSLIGFDITDTLFGDLSGTNGSNTVGSESTLFSTSSGLKPGDGGMPEEADISGSPSYPDGPISWTQSYLSCSDLCQTEMKEFL